MLRFSIAAGALALVFSSPIFAAPITPIAALPTDTIRVVCAEGSPNCQKLDQGHIKAGNQVQEDLKNHGEVDCQGGGICGNAASGGAAAARTGAPKISGVDGEYKDHVIRAAPGGIPPKPTISAASPTNSLKLKK